jgi:membrane protein YqaA with SNARE-associated domain
MASFLDWIKSIAVTLGAPGLFLIGFLDSSFLSFPEVNDLLLVLMVTEHPHRMLAYATAATLGSLAGCLALYYVGRKGGEALIRRRFSSGTVDRTLEVIRRNGVLAILIPSLLPPPAPFKIFVLLAGVAGISARRFTTAIVLGRGARYYGEALLALFYGERALDFLEENSRLVALILLALVVAGAAAYWLWRKVRARAAQSTILRRP